MALENRSEMDHAALEAQELWLACSALQSAIETDGGDGSEVRFRLYFVLFRFLLTMLDVRWNLELINTLTEL